MNFHSVVVFVSVLKLLLNVTICGLFWFGANGSVLGIQGHWRQDSTTPLIELLAGCVFGGFLAHGVLMFAVAYLINIPSNISPESTDRGWISIDALISLGGFLAFLTLGILALHHWTGQETDEKHFSKYQREGTALGSVCIVQAMLYFSQSTLATCFVILLRIIGL